MAELRAEHLRGENVGRMCMKPAQPLREGAREEAPRLARSACFLRRRSTSNATS